MQKVRRIFPGGNTAHGFISLHDNIISENRKMQYIIKGMPGGGKSSLMKGIGERLIEKGYSIEYHHCPSDPYSIDGIAIEELGIGIVDGTPPHAIDPLYPGLKDKIVDLGPFIKEELLKDKESDIIKARLNNKISYKKAFGYLKSAKIVYDMIEDDNKRLVDQKKVKRIGKELLDKIFSKKEIEIKANGFKERHLFSTAYTPEGFIDYTDSILEWISDIYFIQGEIGGGEDLILNRILEEARFKDYHIEIYYNSLLPNQVESIYIKELDTIITLNENGKENSKLRVNLREYMDLDKLNKEDYRVFNQLVERGIDFLKGAKENHFILEKSYRPAVNYSKIDEAREKIYNEILKGI